MQSFVSLLIISTRFDETCIIFELFYDNTVIQEYSQQNRLEFATLHEM